jgi:hypothetical protein
MAKRTPGEQKTYEASQHARRLDMMNKAYMDNGISPWGPSARSQYPLGWGPGQSMPAGPDRGRVAAFVDSFIGPTVPAVYECDM